MQFLKDAAAARAAARTAPWAGVTRRGFLAAAGGAAAGLTVGFAVKNPAHAAGADGADVFNPFVRVAPDGAVTVIIKHLDKGQGAASGLAALAAEELDADWADVKTEFAPADAALYNNLSWGPYQGTGGSSSVPNSYMQYRAAGAAAKAMLKAAAARAWGVPASEITAGKGVLSHPGGRRAGFGEMAAAAAKETPPEKPVMKTPDQFRIIGNASVRRLDSASVTKGEKTFTQDIHLPGMLTAVIARPPRFGGVMKSVDDAAARAVPGVVDVVRTPKGPAVLARSTWAAVKGREALKIEWDDSKAETRSTADLRREYRALLDKPGAAVSAHGDLEAGFAKAAHVIESVYEFPYLAHAPMEPVNAVADLKPGKSLEIWTGSQMQTVDQAVAAAVTGLKPEQVRIHTLFAGGSFGRRATPDADMVSEAAMIAAAVNGRAPVKVVWTREDDIQGGKYRPMYMHRLRAGVDAEGRITAWDHRIAGQSILAGTPFAGMIQNGVDATSVEGARELPYTAAAHRLDLHSPEAGVPVLWWRSVGSTHTAYAVETMTDRLARAAGIDPVVFRLKLISDPREAAVLRLAAQKAGWGRAPAPGVHRGCAVHKSFGTYVAQIADVRLDGGRLKAERVVCAVDCGVAVSPDQIAAQMEGGVGYGLGAALHNRITLTEGRVDQSQFDDYAPLRISEMPHVETHIIPSDIAPTGAGEPGTPPIAPAAANAVLWGTGREINTLPFDGQGLV